MTEVIDLDKRRGAEPVDVIEGDARCLQCDHQWYARGIAAGSWQFACPACQTNKGMMMDVIAPSWHGGAIAATIYSSWFPRARYAPYAGSYTMTNRPR